MFLLRILITFIALCSQAVPASLLAQEKAHESCTKSCCAWLIKAGLAECECLPTQNSPERPIPAPLPPMSEQHEAGQTVWTEQNSAHQHKPESHAEIIGLFRPATDQHFSIQPHVRLTVLFCSFLT